MGLAMIPLLASAELRPEERKLYDDTRESVPHAVVRRDARAILKQDPSSFVAIYVLGLLAAGDGQYPEGIRDLKTARTLIAPRATNAPTDQVDMKLWHARIVLALADALDHADRLPEALQTWDEAELLHTSLGGIPDRTLRRIDALLKLGRFDEAQQVANHRMQATGLSDSERLAVRVAAARILFAREPGGQDAYAAFEAIARDAGQTPGFVPPFGDLAFHALRQGHTERALEYLSQSAGNVNAASASHPFCTRAEIHLAAANWELARADLQQAWNVIQMKRADIRHELIPDTRRAVAHFYLAAGYPERAELLARPYVTLPVRSGFSSRPPEQWQAGVNLLCWSASRQIRAVERASASQRPWRERILLYGHHAIRRGDEAILARRIRALVLAQVQRARPIRDALALVDVPIWLWGDLATALGPGSFQKLLNAYPLRGAPHRFFDRALNLEAMFAAKNWDAVVEQGPAALDSIPPSEALLRARLCQLIAESEYRRGYLQDSLAWYGRAYETDRALPLLTGTQLPVTRLPPELAGSPLLTETMGGLFISAVDAGNGWSCQVDWPTGKHISSAPFVMQKDFSRAQLTHRLHRSLFSPVGLLDEADYAAFEGNAVAGPGEKEDRMDRMLREKNR